jgi:hypothetical protein
VPTYLILLLVFAFVVLSVDAMAGGDRVDVDTDVTTGDTIVGVENSLVGGSLTGGDNTANNSALVEGSRSYALSAPGLSDVDIAGCLGSTSWSFLVGAKQKLVLNHVCMAEFYLKTGQYDLAAQSLCNQKEILAEYATEQECEDAHDFGPLPVAPVSAPEAPKKDEMEDYYREQQMALESLSRELEEIKQEKPKVTRQVVQQRYLTDEQRKALLEVKK